MINTLEHQPFKDKFVQFIMKPLLIAGLYSMYQVSQYIFYSSGKKQYDYNGEIMIEAMDEVFKDRDKDIVYHYWTWLLHSLIRFSHLDSGYNNILHKYNKNYVKLCHKYKYNLPPKRLYTRGTKLNEDNTI